MIRILAQKVHRGFTLLELLIVLAIIGIISVYIWVNLDPPYYFAESRNIRRWSDVNSLSTAIYRKIIDTSVSPTLIDDKIRQIGTASFGCDEGCLGAETGCVDLSEYLAGYFEEIPKDVKGGTSERTLYSVQKIAGNIIVVKSCNEENSAIIKVSR